VLRVPVVGGIFRRFAITQFTRSLGTLLGEERRSFGARECVRPIGNGSSRARSPSRPKVREGGELWRSLDETGNLTDLTIEMIQGGRVFGSPRGMLASVSEFYDEEIDMLLARVISFVEPAILVIMGRGHRDDPAVGLSSDVPTHVGHQVVRCSDMPNRIQRQAGP